MRLSSHCIQLKAPFESSFQDEDCCVPQEDFLLLQAARDLWDASNLLFTATQFCTLVPVYKYYFSLIIFLTQELTCDLLSHAIPLLESFPLL